MAIADIQRSRLLAAAEAVIDQRGYLNVSVGDVTGRARISRRTFYELFANREACLAAIFDEAVALVERELAAIDLKGLAWREQVRAGLWVILSLLDREPALARVCVVQTLHAGSAVVERREAVLARLVAAVDAARRESARAAGCTPLTAEGVVGAALAIVSARLVRREPGPLLALLNELVGMVVLPYLGAAVARRERARPAGRPLADVPRVSRPVPGGATDPLAGVPMRLTYRTALVLEGIGGHPGSSNRQVADYAGIHDAGQVSKLLRRLCRLGLLTNQGEGAHSRGEPNAWVLTREGESVTRSIRMHAATDRQAA